MLYDLGPSARPVYQSLLDRIRSGQLAPGERLPSHTRLAESFGVAPLTMRQVLARLEAEQLVSREHGRGTFVRGPGQGPIILVVTADLALREALVDQIERADRRMMLAHTTAEGLAAIDRESTIGLTVVDLRLPDASDGLRFVRSLRGKKPDLPVVVLDPSRRQTTRLQQTVAQPLVILRSPSADQLAHVLRADVSEMPAPVPDGLLESYLSLQLQGERVSARALLLKAVADGLTVANVYQRVLVPAQHRIGELWKANQITVAREHLATAVTASVMAELAATAVRSPSSATRVMVACVEGELHEIGSRMVADLLELDGFVVRFLGANVPADSLLAMVEEERPRLLALSAAMPDRLTALTDTVARVRLAHGSDLRVAVGGQLVRWVPDLQHRLDVDLVAEDALQTVEMARRIAGSFLLHRTA